MNGASEDSRAQGARALPWVAAAAWVCWQLMAGAEDVTWGWDESQHAELPAARMALYLRAGELGGAMDALHSCTQYPFVWPTLLGVVQALTGPSEAAARLMGVLLWGLTMGGAHKLTIAAGARAGLEERARGWAAWGALALSAASPLASAYAGTLFHAVPTACAVVWALIAWLRRGPGLPPRDLLAGFAFALVFFTKFNYGLLLGAALASDLLFEWIREARAGAAGAMPGRAARLAAAPLALCAWWFFLPLPGGAELATVHREAFLGFLSGNLETTYLSPARRLVEWGAGLHLQPRLLLLVLFGVACSTRSLGKPGARLLGVAALIPAAILWSHPFHLDRFLVPFAPALWCLAALGLASWASSSARAGRAIPWVLLACVIPLGGADSRALAGAVGLMPAAGPERVYVEGELERLGRLGAGRRRPTAGLATETVSGILDACAAEAQPDERVGWLGVSSELSPAALHLGLLERGGERERFLRDAHRALDITFEGVDPGWTDEALAAWAQDFDVLFMTDPPDLGARPARAFMRGYQERLLALGWSASEVLGTYEWQTPFGATRAVNLYACRPTP
ncbi:MAG: hypothetical protein MK291_08865 [Planctomycetes bacterium]|nr:hypothetical protein [Planctomycetota bacterium]